MTAAAPLHDAIVPTVRTRLPAGVDVVYPDDFLSERNGFAQEAVIEQNRVPVLARMRAANRPLVPDKVLPECRMASTHADRSRPWSRSAGSP